MVSVSSAISTIGQHLFRPAKENVKIQCLEGRVLADAIVTDRDLPPFDRVAMDGIGIQFNAYQEGWRDFKVEGIQPAGQPRITLETIRIALR